MKILVWPDRLPPGFEGLGDDLRNELGAEDVVFLPSLDDPAGRSGASTDDVLVAIPEAALGVGDEASSGVAAGLQVLADVPVDSVAVIVGDGYLGTDGDHANASATAASAVSLVRSMAVRRDGGRRANAVCVPDALFGNQSSQRGPLPQPVETADVAHAVAFLLGAGGNYLSGQVLHVNGGRHLFSSQTA